MLPKGSVKLDLDLVGLEVVLAWLLAWSATPPGCKVPQWAEALLV